MKINILHVAKLAKLEIKKTESSELEKQLSSVLDYIDKLKTLDTKNIQETSQVTNLENITRNDSSKPSLDQKDALSQTNSSHNGLFKVSAIFKDL